MVIIIKIIMVAIICSNLFIVILLALIPWTRALQTLYPASLELIMAQNLCQVLFLVDSCSLLLCGLALVYMNIYIYSNAAHVRMPMTSWFLYYPFLYYPASFLLN